MTIQPVRLFELGEFMLSSGQMSDFRINCDPLYASEWDALAHIAAKVLGPFSILEPVQTGGVPFAHALWKYVSNDGPLLIVDDVLTTGRSMERQRNNREAKGIVVFARGPKPPWIKALFSMPGSTWP